MSCDDPHQMQDLQVQKSISARNHGTVLSAVLFFFSQRSIQRFS
jgi:hypothetical protein